MFKAWFYCVCVCVFSDPQSSRARKLCVTIEPALLLKGDIMVRDSVLLTAHSLSVLGNISHSMLHHIILYNP